MGQALSRQTQETKQAPPPVPEKQSAKKAVLSYLKSLDAPLRFDELAREADDVLFSRISSGIAFNAEFRPINNVATAVSVRVLPENDARKEAIEDAQETGQDIYPYLFAIGGRPSKQVDRERFSVLAHFLPKEWCDCVFSVSENGKSVIAISANKMGARAVLKSQFRLPSLPHPRDLILDVVGPDIFIKPHILINPAASLGLFGITTTVYHGVTLGAEYVHIKDKNKISFGGRVNALGGILALTHSPGMNGSSSLSYARLLSMKHPIIGTVALTSTPQQSETTINPKPHRVATIGWLYTVRDGSTARGSIDSDGFVRGSFEEVFGQSLKLGFSTEANFFTREYKWGMSMTVVF